MTASFTVTFSSERPAPGRYYVAIAPNLRGRFGWHIAVLKCTVMPEYERVAVHVHHGYKPKVDITDPVFNGALWAPRGMPPDPFVVADLSGTARLDDRGD